LQVDVPVEWSDVRDDPYGSYAEFGPSVGAAPDLDAFVNSWRTPGMQLAASFDSAGNLDSVFEQIDFSTACTALEIQDYDDGLYTGKWQIWDQCGGIDTAMAVIVAEPPGQEFVVYVQVQLASEADLDALDKVIETFRINVG
jgi:serine protease Do